MSNNAKNFGAGAIISAVLIFTITGVFGWIGVTTAEIPALKAQSKAEFSHINANINKLTVSSIETNKAIMAHAKLDTEIVTKFTETIASHDILLKRVLDDCNQLENEVDDCKNIVRNK